MGRSVTGRRRDVSEHSLDVLKHRLMNKLASRVQTAQQLRVWAIEQGYEAELVEAALADLQRVQVLDDLAFARSLVRAKTDLAAPELRRRMMAAGVEEPIISLALEERDTDDVQACEQLVARLWPRMSKLPYEVAQRRILNQLKRRGFQFSVALSALQRIAGER